MQLQTKNTSHLGNRRELELEAFPGSQIISTDEFKMKWQKYCLMKVLHKCMVSKTSQVVSDI